MSIWNEALQKKIPIQERGKTRIITVLEAIVMQVVNQAAKGDIKATAFVLAKQPEIARQVRPEEKIPLNDPVEAAKIYARIMKDSAVEG